MALPSVSAMPWSIALCFLALVEGPGEAIAGTQASAPRVGVILAGNLKNDKSTNVLSNLFMDTALSHTATPPAAHVCAEDGSRQQKAPAVRREPCLLRWENRFCLLLSATKMRLRAVVRRSSPAWPTLAAAHSGPSDGRVASTSSSSPTQSQHRLARPAADCQCAAKSCNWAVSRPCAL